MLVSVKDPSLRYEVLSYNAATGAATLQGRYAEFEVKPFTKAKILKDGYTLERAREME